MSWNNAKCSFCSSCQDQIHSNQVAWCQPVAVQPVACCHVWFYLLQPGWFRIMFKTFLTSNYFPFFSLHIPLFPRHICLSWPEAFVLPLLKNKVSPKLNMCIYFMASYFRILTSLACPSVCLSSMCSLSRPHDLVRPYVCYSYVHHSIPPRRSEQVFWEKPPSRLQGLE